MSVIQSSAVIGKNEDGSDITQDVGIQFLAIPEASATAECVFSFAGLTPLRPAQISARRYARYDHVGVSQYSFG
jgi:hypothetical protein